jgi:hypothetical protein
VFHDEAKRELRQVIERFDGANGERQTTGYPVATRTTNALRPPRALPCEP